MNISFECESQSLDFGMKSAPVIGATVQYDGKRYRVKDHRWEGHEQICPATEYDCAINMGTSWTLIVTLENM